MTQYEILGETPTGITVAIYHRGKEIAKLNVPAEQCQSKVMLETWLKKQAVKKLPISIPRAVLRLKGRQVLDMG